MGQRNYEAAAMKKRGQDVLAELPKSNDEKRRRYWCLGCEIAVGVDYWEDHLLTPKLIKASAAAPSSSSSSSSAAAPPLS